MIREMEEENKNFSKALTVAFSEEIACRKARAKLPLQFHTCNGHVV